jgi:hypothetical protein
MNKKTILLLAAVAMAPALRAMDEPALKAIPDSQRSHGLDAAMGSSLTEACVVQSVYAPAKEIVYVDESGVRHAETLTDTVVIRNGDQLIAINDLEPGDRIAVVRDEQGDVIRVAVLPGTSDNNY